MVMMTPDHDETYCTAHPNSTLCKSTNLKSTFARPELQDQVCLIFE